MFFSELLHWFFLWNNIRNPARHMSARLQVEARPGKYFPNNPVFILSAWGGTIEHAMGKLHWGGAGSYKGSYYSWDTAHGISEENYYRLHVASRSAKASGDQTSPRASSWENPASAHLGGSWDLVLLVIATKGREAQLVITGWRSIRITVDLRQG